MGFFGIKITEQDGRIREGVRWDETDDIAVYEEKARSYARVALQERLKDIEVRVLHQGDAYLDSWIHANRLRLEAWIRERNEHLGIRSQGKIR